MASPNTNNYSISTTPLLVGDLQTTITGTGLSVPNSNPVPTAVNGVPVAAAHEIQSTTGLALLPRLSDANVTAITTANPNGIVNGMIYYNTTDNVFYFIQNGIPTPIPTGAGSGNVVGPNTPIAGTLAYFPSNLSPNIQDTNVGTFGINILANELIISDSPGTANQLATFTGTTLTGGAGGVIQGVPVTISAGGAVAGITQIAVGLGAVGAPSYSFTGHLTSGIYSATADVTLDFSLAGSRQFQIGHTNLAVNVVSVTGGAAGSPAVIGLAAGGDANAGIEILPAGTGALINAVGAVATPSYSFLGRLDTGMWSSAAATLDFSTTGGRQFQIVNHATAVNFPTVQGAATLNAVTFGSDGSDANVAINFQTKGTGTFGFSGGINNPQFLIGNTATSVNVLEVLGATAGNSPTLRTFGSDANIGVHFLTKGTGNFIFATNNDVVNRIQLEIRDGGAATTGHLAIIAGTGATPSLITLQAVGSATDIDVLVQPKGAAGLVVAGGTGGTAGDITLLGAGGAISTSLSPAPGVSDQQVIILPTGDGAGTPTTGQVVEVTNVTIAGGTSTVTLGYASPADVGLLTATVVVSSAELLALTSAVTKTLVPAQGLGKIVTPFAMIMVYETPGADAYTVSGGLRLLPTIGGITMDNPAFNPVGFLDQTVGKISGQPLFVFGTAFTSSVLDNQPFVIGTNNVAPGLTGGTGTLTITVKYFVTDDGTGP